MSRSFDPRHVPGALALDDATAGRLLGGRLPVDDAPPGYRTVAELVSALVAPTPLDDARRAEAVARMQRALESPEQRRRPAVMWHRRRARRVLVACALGVTLLLVGAVAGALPDPLQRTVAAVLDRVGVHVPSPGDGADEAPGPGASGDRRGPAEGAASSRSTDGGTSGSRGQATKGKQGSERGGAAVDGSEAEGAGQGQKSEAAGGSGGAKSGKAGNSKSGKDKAGKDKAGNGKAGNGKAGKGKAGDSGTSVASSKANGQGTGTGTANGNGAFAAEDEAAPGSGGAVVPGAVAAAPVGPEGAGAPEPSGSAGVEVPEVAGPAGDAPGGTPSDTGGDPSAAPGSAAGGSSGQGSAGGSGNGQGGGA